MNQTLRLGYRAPQLGHGRVSRAQRQVHAMWRALRQKRSSKYDSNLKIPYLTIIYHFSHTYLSNSNCTGLHIKREQYLATFTNLLTIASCWAQASPGVGPTSSTCRIKL